MISADKKMVLNGASLFRFLFFCGLIILASCGSGPSNNSSANLDEDEPSGPNPGDQASYNIRLEWIAPSEREDGTPLAIEELTGYEISVSTDNDSAVQPVTLDSGLSSEYTFTNLPEGRYEFRISAIDTEDDVSEYSAVFDIDVSQENIGEITP